MKRQNRARVLNRVLAFISTMVFSIAVWWLTGAAAGLLVFSKNSVRALFRARPASQKQLNVSNVDLF